MNSLYDIEDEVHGLMQQHMLADGRSLWTALVESARPSNGEFCDGFLLGQAEKLTEKLLDQFNEKQLAGLWKETENGVMSIAQGYETAHDVRMKLDIGVEMTQRIAEAVCEEAKKTNRRR